MGELLHVEDLSCAAGLQVSWYLRLLLESTILTCLQKSDVAAVQKTCSQDHGYQGRATRLVVRGELVPGWTMRRKGCQVGEERVEAYCGMQMMAVQEEVREDLHDDQLWWQLRGEQL